MHTIHAQYCDQMFLQDPAVYQHDLTRLSLNMALAGYSSPVFDSNWNVDREVGRQTNVNEAFRQLGFLDSPYEPLYTHYDMNLNDSSDKVAFSIAAKDIVNPEIDYKDDIERKEHLVAVVLRGGGYGCEWASNFNVGTRTAADEHRGFANAADDVFATVSRYIRDNFTDGRPVRIWITGYSRSAITSNLTSYRLLNAKESLGIKALYCYCFATPAGTKVADKHLDGIYNFVYDKDLIPRVAFDRWGYSRHGTTMVISTENVHVTPSQQKRISETYRQITGGAAEYDPLGYSGIDEEMDMLVASLVMIYDTDEEFIIHMQPTLTTLLECLMANFY